MNQIIAQSTYGLPNQKMRLLSIKHQTSLHSVALVLFCNKFLITSFDMCGQLVIFKTV